MHHGDVKSFVKSKRENNINVKEFPLVYNKLVDQYTVLLAVHYVMYMYNY